MRLIIIGIQGAGKSTQGNLLSKKLNIPYLSTGHIFRVLAQEKTPLGRYIKEVMNAGYLIPDRKVLKIVMEYLQRPEYKRGYILDGFPRTIGQARAFQNGIDWAVYLRVSDREALWRISYRETNDREDETLAAIRKRIELFHKFTEPVLGFYRHNGNLIEIDGEQKIREIHKEVMDQLKERVKEQKEKRKRSSAKADKEKIV
ncbi:MAG TPA: nucleoside monophosphate kinase [Candidatus Saccharimonadales bacterium]|nr:nucleoside monophosphate kinase [Candidatus Saccharimonadales bacterium]